MTHIKEVTVGFGATINLGNYESMRVDVTIKADMSAAAIDDGDLNALLYDAQKEVAFGLFDQAETKLRAVHRWELEDESERNQGRAIGVSPEFRWMVKLHPEMAADLLANVVNDYWEAKKPSVPMIAVGKAFTPVTSASASGRGEQSLADEPELSKEEVKALLEEELDDLEDEPDDDDVAEMEADAIAEQDGAYEAKNAAAIEAGIDDYFEGDDDDEDSPF